MNRLILGLGVLVLALSAPASAQKDKTVKKDLGDINGDGKHEIAIEKTKWAVSTCATDVKITSGNRTVLIIPVFMGDTADGYKVVGHQIVAWHGDWFNQSSKWKPHFYNFTWYSWDNKNKKYMRSQEGFTKKPYDGSLAEKLMPQLAANPGNAVIQSKGVSFAAQALELVREKYGKRFKFTKMVPLTSGVEEGDMENAHSYVSGDEFAAVVTFCRDGTHCIGKMDGE